MADAIDEAIVKTLRRHEAGIKPLELMSEIVNLGFSEQDVRKSYWKLLSWDSVELSEDRMVVLGPSKDEVLPGNSEVLAEGA